MKIKKLISLFLAFTLSITSTVNCFAGGSNSGSDSEYDSDDSFSDIVVPELLVSGDDLERQLTNIDTSIQEVQQLREQLSQANARIIDIRAISESNRAAFNRTDEELRQTRAELSDAQRDLQVTQDALSKYGDDIMCTCFRRNPVSEVTSLLGYDMNPIPISSVLRSKRFYKGVLTGAIIVAVVLVGIYVYVYYIHAPARSE